MAKPKRKRQPDEISWEDLDRATAKIVKPITEAWWDHEGKLEKIWRKIRRAVQ